FRPAFSRRRACSHRRTRGDVACDLARRARRRADPHRPRLRARSDGANPRRAGARAQSVRRDLPAISVPDRGRPRSAGLRRREVRMALLFSEGVGTGRIDLPRFVALTATNAAKLYGLHPRKGTIAVGADADLAIWDADKEVTISQSMIHDAMDYTPYEGRKIKGWPVATLLRGELVAQAGEFVGDAGNGRVLKCNIS